MQEREARQHTIKRGIGEGQILGIAFVEFDPGKFLPCDRDHLARKIETDRGRPAPGRGRGDVAGSATHIENRHSFADFSGIEQERDELPG